MKALTLATVAGLAFMGAIGPIVAQPYGGSGARDRDYRDDDRGGSRDPREDRRDRRDGRDDRRDDRSDRGDRRDDRGDRRGVSFDEGEYLRCNPDVRRAVRSGQMESGRRHFETFGRREGRKLTC